MIGITGYSGFVGRHLLAELDESECLLFGRKSPESEHKYYGFDLTNHNQADLTHLLLPITVIIHCAARVHVMNHASVDPLALFRAANTEGTLNLARQSAKAGVKRFIFLSSIKVNGEATCNHLAFKSSDVPAPQDPYSVSKAEAEQQLMDLGAQTGMEIVIIRSPLVYGEGVKANFSSLMTFIGKGFPTPFRSINTNERSLVSVYNLVDLIRVCIGHANAANQIFLVSDDNDLSTADIVSLMSKVQGKINVSLPVPACCFKLAGKIFGKTDKVDRLTGSLKLDIEHTKCTLAWVPPYTVEHGFKLAVKNKFKC